MKAASTLTPRTSHLALPRGFSFVEIMVVVALLSVIVLGLMAMFNQTQRAFRLGLSQTDILESGRMATDMMARELEQVTPCYYSNYNATQSGSYVVPNFFAPVVQASIQNLPGSGAFRTNIMQDLFFLVRQNQTWTGIGYFVRADLRLSTNIGPVGTLYRFETNNTVTQFQQNPGGLYTGYGLARSTTNANPGVSRILDGVVHFRIRPLDTSGYELTRNPAWWVNPVWNANSTSSLPSMLLSTNLMPLFNGLPQSGEPLDYPCFSNAVPASVELEIGLLEQHVYEQYKSIPTEALRWEFLTNAQARAVSHVHVFRKLVPVRNVDPAAYR